MQPSRRKMLVIRRVSGHSMGPALPSETLVWATGWYRQPRVGNIVIFLHEGREKIKLVAKIKDERLYVLGSQPEASSDSRQFGWIESTSVIAKVLWPRTPKYRADQGKET